MKDLLTFILKNITTHPEDIQIEENIENGVKVFTITTHPEDTGRVIGKEGKVIKAIRAIMKVAAIQRAERVRVTVISDDQPENSSTDISDTEEPINLTAEDQHQESSPQESPTQAQASPADQEEDQIDLAI